MTNKNKKPYEKPKYSENIDPDRLSKTVVGGSLEYYKQLSERLTAELVVIKVKLDEAEKKIKQLGLAYGRQKKEKK